MIPPIYLIPKWLLELWENEMIEQTSICLRGHFLQTNIDSLPEIEA